jgi:hypothetical protein
MRMDIEISPDAPVQRSNAPARDNMGLAGRVLADCDGRMTGKRVCSMRHPAPLRGECRFIEERMKGNLWRHFKLQPRGTAVFRTVRGRDSSASAEDRM